MKSNRTEKVDTIDLTDSFSKIRTINPTKDKIHLVDRNQDSLEEKIYNAIFSLPEVKKIIKETNVKSKGLRNINVMIYQRPEETEKKCYWVKVGENNEIRFVTYYNFIVDPITLKISFFDTINDKFISLEDWRKIAKNDY